jgi:hypothetical protein
LSTDTVLLPISTIAGVAEGSAFCAMVEVEAGAGCGVRVTRSSGGGVGKQDVIRSKQGINRRTKQRFI